MNVMLNLFQHLFIQARRVERSLAEKPAEALNLSSSAFDNIPYTIYTVFVS